MHAVRERDLHVLALRDLVQHGREVAAGLPEWFDKRATTTSIPIDIKHQRGFVADRQGKVVGFITLYVAEGKLNIGWLGVHHDLHRQGIGRALLAKATDVARELGLRELATYTLGDGVDYEPYERTRQFYARHGAKTIVIARFVPIIRTFAPVVAGVGQMAYRRFVFYNIAGGMGWVISMTWAGYLLGRVIPDLDRYIHLVVAIVIVLSVIPIGIEIARERRKRSLAP